jgi:hypothetical protein
MMPSDFASLYSRFHSPICALDCGRKCAPYNSGGKPFCCDTQHAVPTAYEAEWAYLQDNTDLWHIWENDDPGETKRLQDETPPGMVLVACLGPAHCQREYRTLTCRQFPFFPYITSEGVFIGLSYYWDYEADCWVISNLHKVNPEYQAQCIAAYDLLFERMPGEVASYLHHSEKMRKFFNQRHRAIPLLHRNGQIYKITPHNERLRRVSVGSLSRFGDYEIAAAMPFPDEME